jgi:hypothetical protein
VPKEHHIDERYTTQKNTSIFGNSTALPQDISHNNKRKQHYDKRMKQHHGTGLHFYTDFIFPVSNTPSRSAFPPQGL